MKTPSFKSLASMLLAGALSASLVGCESPVDDQVQGEGDQVTSESSGIIRAAAVGDVEIAATESPIVVQKQATAIFDAIITDGTVSGAGGSGGATGGATGPTDLESNHPWTVFTSGTGNLSCRGTLIHPLWVLTAAHCVGPFSGDVSYSRKDPVTGVVSGGSRPVNVNGPQRGMFIHPDYVPDDGFGQPKNDIALLRLTTPLAIDRNIQTAALPRWPSNPGRTGTVVTNNHNNAPAGYVSVLRAPQLPANECPSPAGFFCINPPAGSVCHGDSGSGFVEILDGRATVIGVTSNMDSDGGDCVPAGRQAQFADVFTYRDWIYATMGMSPEQVDGQVRLRWSGWASQPGIMSLQCLSDASVPSIEVTMNAPGSEISMNCEDARVFCQPQGNNLNLSSFTQRTFAGNGALLSTQSLPFLPTFTAAFADPGSSFLGFTCGVYNRLRPSVVLKNGGVLVQAF